MKLQPRLKPNFTFKEIISLFKPLYRSVAYFEKKFAEKFNNKNGVMFSHGRVALYSLFKLWGLSNDEIICPAYTCVVVPNAIVLSGNIPVFIDCEKNSWNMSYEEIEKNITNKTRAIVVTHLFGYPMDVCKIQRIVSEAEIKYKKKIYVIQDCAHSFGCEWNGQIVTKFGDASFFGLNISKIITSVFGGIVITDDAKLYKGLIEFRKTNFKKGILKNIKRLVYFLTTCIIFNQYIYGIINWLENKGFLDAFVKYYDENIIDFPKDWKELPCHIEAIIGLSQLKKYDYIINQKRKNSLLWFEEIKNNNDLMILDYDKGTTFSHCVALTPKRKELLETYRTKGIQLGIIIEYCIPEMPSFKKYNQGKEFPISSYYSKSTVNFPNWANLSKKYRIASS